MAEADDALVEFAERVAAEAAALGIQTALIGAAALAVHNYVRATEDIDLAAHVDLPRLRLLEARLRALGHEAKLNLPDEMDDLGGVLDVRESEGSELLQIVNFYNALRPRETPAKAAIQAAVPMHDVKLSCVSLEDLIALKLDANGPQDRADVLRLLENNPSADLETIRARCAAAGLQRRLQDLLDGRSEQT